MSDRTPTRKQYDRLRALADPGCILISGIGGNRRAWRSLLAHGWVIPKDPERDPENGLQITPGGLRALAAYVEANGQPGWHLTSQVKPWWDVEEREAA